MNDLITFLHAQLDDDERVAETIRHGGYLPPIWHAAVYSDGSADIYAEQRINNAPADEPSEIDEPFAHVEPDRAQHEHIARWDPARVLADIAAKRRILDDCAGYIEIGDAAVTDGMAWRTLYALALPYADREGYRDEWPS
jgi:hypothetical protein